MNIIVIFTSSSNLFAVAKRIEALVYEFNGIVILSSILRPGITDSNSMKTGPAITFL